MAQLETALGFVLGDATTDEENRITKILRSWTESFQSIEDTAQDMILQKNVDDAEGAQLDALGKLVGQGRAGLSDPDYRRYISARVTTNRSDGIVEDLIKIAVLVLNAAGVSSPVVTQEGTATVRVRIASTVGITDSLANILFLFENAAKSAGVRLVLQWGDVPDSQLFRLDSGPGLDTGHLAGALG